MPVLRATGEGPPAYRSGANARIAAQGNGRFIHCQNGKRFHVEHPHRIWVRLKEQTILLLLQFEALVRAALLRGTAKANDVVGYFLACHFPEGCGKPTVVKRAIVILSPVFTRNFTGLHSGADALPATGEILNLLSRS